MEFTYENLSYYDVDANVGFYISTDSNITTGDGLIKTHSGMSLAIGTAFIKSIAVKIPADLDGGKTCSIGAIVSYGNQIANENN